MDILHSTKYIESNRETGTQTFFPILFSFKFGRLLEGTLHTKWTFLLRTSSLNVTKSAGNCGFGHIY